MKRTPTLVGRFALTGVAAAALCLTAPAAWSLGLGRLQVQSALGESLRAEIDVTSMTPEEAAIAIRAAPGRAAILFGPERSGLETDDVALARAILTVPINPGFGSLNLAQAVVLVAYEWSKHAAGQSEGALASPPAAALDPPAPQIELDGLVAQLEAMLEAAHYFYPPDRVPSTRRTLRGLLTKPGWSSQEVRTLRGVLSTLERPRGPGRS